MVGRREVCTWGNLSLLSDSEELCRQRAGRVSAAADQPKMRLVAEGCSSLSSLRAQSEPTPARFVIFSH